MDSCTENYECLVINNNAKSNKLDEQVYWYKAEPHEPFRIGSDTLWNHHTKYYNPNHNSDDDDENALVPQKKNQTKLLVKKIK